MSETSGQPAGAGGAAAGARRSGRRWRLWVFRAVSATVIPAAFFALLELGLRAGGYGHDTAFFVPLGGGGELRSNQKFAWQYFPPTGTRAPIPVRFQPRKPPGTCRIFVFGGSAAMGSPEPAFGFGRILEEMLRDRYAGVRFELLNAAMEAMNSHVARSNAEQCSRYQPDLFIVYLGNNEVVGPYGLSDSFSGFSPSLPMIRAGMWLKSTRTGQLLSAGLDYFRFRGQAPIWRGMETFVAGYVPADDPRLERTYRHFAANLGAICDTARAAGAPVLLCTVSVNLKDCAPTAPAHRRGLSSADRRLWEELFDTGRALQTASRWQEAAAKYLAAAEVDDRRADLHYMLGRCLAEMGRSAEAKRHLVLARDLDTLRMRADSGIDRTIRQVAGQWRGRGVQLVDAEAAVEHSPLARGGLVGNELFVDHCHLNFEGNWVLAAAVLDQIDAALPAWVKRGDARPAPPPDAAACAERLAFTGWERYRLATQMAKMTLRAPFTARADHPEQQAAIAAEVEKLRAHTLPAAKEANLAAYRKALAARPGDLLIRADFAICLAAFGEPLDAAEEWRGLLRDLPGQAEFHRSLGLCLLGQQRFAEAVEQFSRALDILPRDLNARNNLGAALLWLGRRDEAERLFRQVLRQNGDHADARVNLASVLAAKGRVAEAAAQLREALRADPAHVDARRNLARMLLKDGKVAEATDQLRETIRIREDFLSHLDLAGLLAQQGRGQEAMEHYRRAVALAPGEPLAYRQLGAAQLAAQDYAAAAETLRRAVELDGSSGQAHRDLGIALQQSGRTADAAGQYAKAIDRLGDDADTRIRLAYVLTLMGRSAEAIDEYLRAVRADPARADAHNNLATLLAQAGRTDEAIEHLSVAVRLEPTAPRHYNLAALLAQRQKDRQAVVHYRQAMEARPGWPEAMEGLAWVLATSGDERVRNGGQAVELARRACELTGFQRAESLDSLAAALAEAGQFAQAARTADQARALAEKAGNTSLAGRIARRIQLYGAGKPCRRAP